MKRTCATCGTDYAGRACPTCNKPKPSQQQRTDALPYRQCAWEGNGLRCRYPGTFTSSVRADESTQWWCKYHDHETDGEQARIAAEASQDYVHPTTEDLLHEATIAALDRLEAAGLGQRFGESNRDYIARLIEEARARTRRLVKQVKATSTTGGN